MVVNAGWTLGEECLFQSQTISQSEKTVAEGDCCLMGISKQALTELQRSLLEDDNTADYFALEATLKGNWLLKSSF